LGHRSCSHWCHLCRERGLHAAILSHVHDLWLVAKAPTAVPTALPATTENEKQAIPVEPRGESAKADFAVSGATSVAGRVQPPRRRIINQKVILFFRAASMPRGAPPMDENDCVLPLGPATVPPTRPTWHAVDAPTAVTTALRATTEDENRGAPTSRGVLQSWETS